MMPRGFAHESVRVLCQALAAGLQAVLGDNLYALYVYGAVVFPETGSTGDIDFHVILKSELTQAEIAAIQALHQRLGHEYPPLGEELDGYYFLLEAAQRPEAPVHQLRPEIRDDSWALHRAHILAGRCEVLYGPQPEKILPAPTWAELEAGLAGELRYVEKVLARYPDYCILNLCRLMYSYETQDVVISKVAAAAWAGEKYPQWQRLIELARRSYARQASEADRQSMLAGVGAFLTFARERIADITGA